MEQAIQPHSGEGLVGINKQHICILLLQLPASQNLVKHKLVICAATLRPESILTFMQQRLLLLLLVRRDCLLLLPLLLRLTAVRVLLLLLLVRRGRRLLLSLTALRVL